MLVALVVFVVLQTVPLLAGNSEPAYPTIYHALNLYETKLKKSNINYMDSIFVPLGWSENGKFAYITEVINEAGDFGDFAVLRWVIQDMVNDKIIWETGMKFEEELPKKFWNADTSDIFKWEYDNLIKKQNES